MARPNLIYMPEETTPTIATDGNRKAVAYLELNEDDDDHDHYGRLFATSPRVLAALKELTEYTAQWIGHDFVHPYDEDLGETPDTFLSPYRRLIAEAEGEPFAEPTPVVQRLLNILNKILPEIDSEIEQRQHGGNDEDWAALKLLSDEAHAAAREAIGVAA